MAHLSAAARQPLEAKAQLPKRPIDLVHLAKQCLGDAGLEREVLHMFDTTIQSYLARLQADGAGTDMRHTLHSMRGAAAGVGAWTIVELAQQGEAELETGKALSAERRDDLAVAVEEVRGFIARMLETAEEE